MIADANLIAMGLLMFPVAFISRRPSGPQNRGRAFTGGGGGAPSNVVIDDSTSDNIIDDSTSDFVTDG